MGELRDKALAEAFPATTDPRDAEMARYAERVELAVVDGLTGDAIPLSIALVIVAQFKDVVRSGRRS